MDVLTEAPLGLNVAGQSSSARLLTRSPRGYPDRRCESRAPEPVEETQEEDQPEEKPAESFVEASEPTEEKHDYKKRYDDLKRHYDEKVRDFKQREKEMEAAMQTVATNPDISLPKSPEELEKFKLVIVKTKKF